AYVYTVDTGGGEVPSARATVVVAQEDAVTVGGLPTGSGVTVRIYRMGVAPTVGTCYGLVTTQADNASPTFVDTVASPASCLPRSENRVAVGAVGTWYDFAPNTLASTGLFGDTPAATLPLGHNGKGWLVEGAGSVHFPADTWRFTVPTRGIHTNGEAKLTVGLWKVRSDGTVTGQLLAPTNGAQTHSEAGTLVTTNSVVQTTTVEVAVGAFSLAEDEHLYVQLWRNQTVAYTSGTGAARIVTLFFWDGEARIEHPAVLPDPSLPIQTAPADAASVSAWPQLSARFDDPVAGDTGTLDFELCADSDCSSVLESGSVAGLANGATGTWSPAALGEGTYYWRVRAQDAGGGISTWSPVRSFVYASAPSPPPPEPAPAAPPATPVGFGGSIDAAGLTLRWLMPLGGTPVAFYALYVDGVLSMTFDGKTFQAALGPSGSTDGRTFALAAVDSAGKSSPLTPALVGMPNLVGLNREAAAALAAKRGLVLADPKAMLALNGSSGNQIVVEQVPSAPALVEVGTELTVSLVALPAVESLLQVARESVSCRAKRLLAVGVVLRERARVDVVLVAKRGRGPWRRIAAARAKLQPGARTVRLPMPTALGSRLDYELRVTATAGAVRETRKLGIRSRPAAAGPGTSLCSVEAKAGLGSRATLPL
ncbi:MAG TPA: hypothetical protein VMQ81_11675, partial [Acidimicrobiia bacterium]|nr:hypothetical protein [Acidimicrobiia bacterium]